MPSISKLCLPLKLIDRTLVRPFPNTEAPPHQMAPTTPRTAPEASAPIEGTSLSLSRSKSGRPHQRQHWHRRTFSTNYIKRQESGGKEKGGAGAVDDAAAGGAGGAPAAAPAAGSAVAKKKASNPKDHPHFVWILWGSFVLTINAGFIVSTPSHAYLGGRTCLFGWTALPLLTLPNPFPPKTQNTITLHTLHGMPSAHVTGPWSHDPAHQTGPDLYTRPFDRHPLANTRNRTRIPPTQASWPRPPTSWRRRTGGTSCSTWSPTSASSWAP